MRVLTYGRRLQQAFSGPRGKRLGTWISNGFMLGVCVFLAVRLSHIGWGRILGELPSHPLFYIILLAQYLILPLSETLIYRRAWGFRFREGLPAFVKKRIYNKDVLGYSGEVYLYVWARKALRLPDRQIIGVVKDNNIVSSVTSTAFAVLVLLALFYTGQIAVAQALEGHSMLEVAGVGVLVAGAGALAVVFRRRLFHLPTRALAAISGIQIGRLVVSNVLQVVQWSIVMPEVDLQVWFTLLATMIVTSRIPFLPGRDLIFMSVGVSMAGALNISSAALAGMLGVASVLDKALNFMLFPLLTRLDLKRAQPAPAEASAVETAAEPIPGLASPGTVVAVQA